MRQKFPATVCGDGVCDAPEETKAFGRFGCMADCGLMQTTQVVVALEFDITRPADYAVPATYNVCHQSERERVNATWVQTVPLCVWAEARVVPKPSQLTRATLRFEHTLQLPDGYWQLQVEAPASSGTTAYGGIAVSSAGVERPADGEAGGGGGRKLLSLLGDPRSARVQRIRRRLMSELPQTVATRRQLQTRAAPTASAWAAYVGNDAVTTTGAGMGSYAECSVRLDALRQSVQPACLAASHFNAAACCPGVRQLLAANCFCSYAVYEERFAVLFPRDVLAMLRDVCVPHLNLNAAATDAPVSLRLGQQCALRSPLLDAGGAMKEAACFHEVQGMLAVATHQQCMRGDPAQVVGGGHRR